MPEQKRKDKHCTNIKPESPTQSEKIMHKNDKNAIESE